MQPTFRQSMAWLHTWAGLLAGWVLFFVFLTGTFGYLNSEIDRWMKPELPLASSSPPASSLLPLAERYLSRQPDGAKAWFILFPGQRNVADLTAGWQGYPSEGDERDGEAYVDPLIATLDPSTGEPVERTARETSGGAALYYMHYTLHYIPYEWATLIVGVCSMFMLVAILSGIVTHKKIFKDFFTFRPGKGQRSWLDGHNLLSVTALPYHLMITWTGLVFYMFTYMPIAADALYPGQDIKHVVQAKAGLYPHEVEEQPSPAAPLVPLAPLLAQAEQALGTGRVTRIVIDHPGRANARIAFSAYNVADHSGGADGLRFDGVSGARLPDPRTTAPGRFNSVLFTLHEGHFAGAALRLLFVVAGLAGTAMIATGLVLWSAKRKAKLAKDGRPDFGMVAVDILNIGTIIGLPIGIAIYFWANRLIPAGLEERDHWEIHAMFIAWGLTFLYATWRRQDRAWVELTWLAAAVWGLLPLLNAMTTDRHLGITAVAGDWVLAGIDLGMFAAGLVFAIMALTMQRKRAKTGRAPGNPKASMQEFAQG